MAYTYDQFVTAATGAGMLDKFNDDDLRIVRSNPEYGMSALKLHQDMQGAKTTEQKMLAQESLNQLRKSYGGSAQSGTVQAVQTSAAQPLQVQSSTAQPQQVQSGAATGGTAGNQAQGGYSYGNQTAYQKLLEEATNPEPFAYDITKDPSFQSLKKTHLREADRATEDTMASYAAMTGGVPSSAAITAASQAGDYFRGQLNDAIPTLYQNAYQRYLAGLDAKNAALNAMAADRNFDWQKYLTEYDQAFNREQFDWQKQMAENDRNFSREQFDWQKYLAEYDQQQNQIQQDTAAKQQAWNNAFALYKELGYATPEIAAILGIEASAPQTGGQYYNPNPRPQPEVDVSADYLALKQSGATARELDNFLKSAIAAGLIDQRKATELRQMRY